MIKRKNIIQLLVLTLVIIFGITGVAEAGVFSSATSKAQEIFESLKKLIFVLGSFGLVGIATGAMFGKVKWSWFATLSVGLFMVSFADQVVDFITAAPQGSFNQYNMEQSFGDSFGPGGLNDFGEELDDDNWG